MNRAQKLRAPSSPPTEGEGRPDFLAVYDRYAAFVGRSLRRLGVGEAALDDALQEVFLIVHRRLEEFTADTGSYKTWLFRIAMNVAQNARRSQRRKAWSPGGAEAGGDPDRLAHHGADPLDRLIQDERLRLLDAVLDRLDDDKRAVFVLHEIEQLTIPEVAGALDINVNTAYSRLRSARASFEEALRTMRGSGT